MFFYSENKNKSKTYVARVVKLAVDCCKQKKPDNKAKPKQSTKKVINPLPTFKSALKNALRNAPKTATNAVDKSTTKAVAKHAAKRAANKPIIRGQRRKAGKEADVTSNKRIRNRKLHKAIKVYVPKVI